LMRTLQRKGLENRQQASNKDAPLPESHSILTCYEKNVSRKGML